MVVPRRYSEELKEHVTRVALDARQNRTTKTGAIKRIADQLGIHPEALRTWVRQAEIDAGEAAEAPRPRTRRSSPTSSAGSASCGGRTRS